VSPLFHAFVKKRLSRYNPRMRTLRVSPDDHDRRLDRVLRKAFPDLPPGAIAGAIRRGAVRVNGARSRNNARLHLGDTLTVPAWETGAGAPGKPQSSPRVQVRNGEICSGNQAVPVLARTSDWIAINKPPGLATHGEASAEELVREAARREGWWQESLSFRPGPVHRLDRGTSGVLLIALSTHGARTLTAEIRNHRMIKLYVALVQGDVSGIREISYPLRYDHHRRKSIADTAGGVRTDETDETGETGATEAYRAARTRIVPLRRTARRSGTLVAAIPITGRTHQIRAHCAAAGHPLEGDGKYARGPRHTRSADGPPESYLLHAMMVAMPDPGYRWKAPFPERTRNRIVSRFGGIAEVEDRLEALFRELEREFPQPPVLPVPGGGTIEA
jgi:23S rRNA pseudouridine955/2504/2580 synthase